MRVIAGEFRGRNLESLEGLDTRPTLDRVKEALFSIIQNYLYDARVLDLFSGSGGLGIEAISRGASKVIFNDLNIKAVNVIKTNLNNLKIETNLYQVLNKDYTNLIEEIKEEFDLVLLDPPYKMDISKEIIEKLNKQNKLAKHAIIAVETSNETKLDDIEGFAKKEYKYGSVKLSIYKKGV